MNHRDKDIWKLILRGSQYILKIIIKYSYYTIEFLSCILTLISFRCVLLCTNNLNSILFGFIRLINVKLYMLLLAKKL